MVSRSVSIQVVYEDACMAGVVKPQGLPMHGDATVPSLLSGLSHVLQPTEAVGALPRPQHVHRLDLPTGGLVLIAKTRSAQVFVIFLVKF
jgi:tRNA pseudouridine65 synthase/23S rRNA pseudouridine1911/1915/1917 synthase